MPQAEDVSQKSSGPQGTERRGPSPLFRRAKELHDQGGRSLRSCIEQARAELAEGTRRHSVQEDVRQFHLALDIPCGDTPAIRRTELRASLIEEEAKETVDAIRAGDLIEAIDGLCDLLCVTYGAAEEFGIDLAPFWDEVHRTNMAKQGGPVREDGKRLKPPGWTPPDIEGVLACQTP